MKPINEMTLEEIKESLKFLGDNNNNIPFEVIQKACYDYADRIHELTRWIPVSERLPEEGDYVLVEGFKETDLGGRKDELSIGAVSWESVEKSYCPDTCGYYVCYTEITRWQRINPPEG